MGSTLRLLAAAAAIASLFAAGSSSATTGSGLYGSVRKGPVMPVCRQGVPCDAPVQLTLVFSRSKSSGGTMETDQEAVKSDKNGRYRIALAPGFYDVRAAKKVGITKVPKPRAVHVRVGHWDRINLFFDTGIR